MPSLYDLHFVGPSSKPSWNALTRSKPLPCAEASVALVPGLSRRSRMPASAVSRSAAVKSNALVFWACLDHAPAKQSAWSSEETVSSFALKNPDRCCIAWPHSWARTTGMTKSPYFLCRSGSSFSASQATESSSLQ